MNEILVMEDPIPSVTAEGEEIVIVEAADTQVFEIAAGDNLMVVVDGTCSQVVQIETPPVTIMQVNAIETGPQGPPGNEAQPEPGTILRDDAGQITQIQKKTRIISLTRLDGRLNSVTDGNYTIRFHRGPDGVITGWSVAREEDGCPAS